MVDFRLEYWNAISKVRHRCLTLSTKMITMLGPAGLPDELRGIILNAIWRITLVRMKRQSAAW